MQKAPLKTYELSDKIFKEDKEFLKKFIEYNINNKYLIVANS